jgi:hypothetical protein
MESSSVRGHGFTVLGITLWVRDSLGGGFRPGGLKAMDSWDGDLKNIGSEDEGLEADGFMADIAES